MPNYDYSEAQETLEYIYQFTNITPKTAIVSGSGLGDIANLVEDPIAIDAENIPNWPSSTAPGHAGKIILGTISARPVIMLQGRVHYYEGHSPQAVTFPTRVLAMMGVSEYIATNASGAVNRDYSPGDIIAVRDHINLMGLNPLIGPNEPRWNVRFPDMSHAYDPAMLDILSGLGLNTGVYAAFMGPSFETPAEIHMAGLIGADLAGMSTVPEIITANAMSMRCCVLSCVANMAAGIEPDKTLTGYEVLEEMKKSSHKVAEIIRTLIERLNEEDK